MKTLIVICAFALPMSLSAQLKMESNGNIGIGTTSPTSRLEVNNGDLTIKAGPSTTTDPGDLIFQSGSGVEYGRIFTFPDALKFRANPLVQESMSIMNPTGNVAIKMGYASSTFSLDILGWARSNWFYSISDERFKNNIVQLPTSRTSDLYKLGGYTYDFSMSDYARTCNGNSTDSTKTNYDELKDVASIGIIAQEVQQFYPELVEADDYGYLAVNYDGLIPIMIEALKEQKAEIEALKESYSNLESSSTNSQGKPFNGRLEQNVPNPFSDITKIIYEINDAYSRASINVYDLSGTLKLSKSLEGSKGEVSILESELFKGMFIYNLVVDGQEVASKKMIIQ